MRLHRGDHVTLVPTDQDDYILQFQRYATVTRTTDAGVYFTVSATIPRDREFGPFPTTQLLPGWEDADGRPRTW